MTGEERREAGELKEEHWPSLGGESAIPVEEGTASWVLQAEEVTKEGNGLCKGVETRENALTLGAPGIIGGQVVGWGALEGGPAYTGPGMFGLASLSSGWVLGR